MYILCVYIAKLMKWILDSSHMQKGVSCESSQSYKCTAVGQNLAPINMLTYQVTGTSRKGSIPALMWGKILPYLPCSQRCCFLKSICQHGNSQKFKLLRKGPSKFIQNIQHTVEKYIGKLKNSWLWKLSSC